MSRRLATGGRIDRGRPIPFTFDGRPLTGFAGDTLASALLANDIILAGRSFKYHRPRGIFSAGPEEPNSLVTVGEGARREPNLPATTVELCEGLVAESQNRWPSLGFDLQAVNSLFAPLLPAGFYYKTFMGPTRRAWMAYEPWIRRAAGLGRASEAADPDRYETRHAFCDVAVIGAGPAGLAAAIAAARAGARVLLVEQHFELGGALLSHPAADPGSAWLAAVLAELVALPNLQIMTRTTAFGLYDGGTLGLVERCVEVVGDSPSARPRQRLVLLRCRAIAFATGAIERPLLFAGNDRPGIMLASAARSYLHRHGILAGRRILVATNNDSAYATALDLAKAGAEVTLGDLRAAARPDLVAAAAAAGIQIQLDATIVRTRGRRRISGVDLASASGAGAHLGCDLLCVSGGWSPTVHLPSHLGVRPRYRTEIGAFVAEGLPDGQFAAGAAAGTYGSAACVAEGARAGTLAAQHCGLPAASRPVPVFAAVEAEPLAAVPAAPREPAAGGKAFVDLQNDVTIEDVRLAHREGYISVEHLKRYTTLGMGTDQGKTSNLVGLELMAALRAASPEAVGTTTFRPPYSPVAIGALAGRSVGQHFRPIRRTAMHDWHVENGAEMVEVGWWLRPWFYRANGATVGQAYVKEMQAVREAAGLIDISTLGKVEVDGADAVEFLDRIYANRLSGLPLGRARYGVMLRDDGIVFDDGTVTRIAEQRFFVTTSTAKAADVMSWLEFLLDTAWSDLRVHVTSVTEDWAAMSLAGPRSRLVLAAAFPVLDLSDAALPHMGFLESEAGGGPAAHPAPQLFGRARLRDLRRGAAWPSGLGMPGGGRGGSRPAPLWGGGAGRAARREGPCRRTRDRRTHHLARPRARAAGKPQEVLRRRRTCRAAGAAGAGAPAPGRARMPRRGREAGLRRRAISSGRALHRPRPRSCHLRNLEPQPGPIHRPWAAPGRVRPAGNGSRCRPSGQERGYASAGRAARLPRPGRGKTAWLSRIRAFLSA
jgi:methylglutamate dehydrogenase subunit C